MAEKHSNFNACETVLVIFVKSIFIYSTPLLGTTDKYSPVFYLPFLKKKVHFFFKNMD